MTHATAVGMGIARLGTGLALAAAPGAPSRLLQSKPIEPFTRVAVRGLGARDLAIGAGLIAGLRSGGEVWPWLLAGAVADAADATALLAEGRQLPRPRKAALVVVATASSASGALLALRTRSGGRGAVHRR